MSVPAKVTTAPLTKLEPFTVRVNCGPPAKPEVGVRLEIAGAALMGKFRVPDSAPPGFLICTVATPGVATSADGTEYTFSLQSGAKCHDGSPLDANDVKYTIDRAFDSKNPSVTKASWGDIESATVADPLTVKIKLKSPI